MKQEFAIQILKKYSDMKISRKILPVGAELSCADGWRDGQTDMLKLIVAFHNFANELYFLWNYLFDISIRNIVLKKFK